MDVAFSFEIKESNTYKLLIKSGLLTERLAQCYMILYKYGINNPSGVRKLLKKDFDITNETDAKIREKLNKLKNMNFVEEVGENIISNLPAPNFKPNKLEVAIKDIINFIEESEYKAFDDRLENHGYYKEREYTRWIKNRKNSIDKILKIVSFAEKNVLISCNDGTWGNYRKSRDVILEAKKKDIEIKFLISPKIPKSSGFLTWLKSNDFNYKEGNDMMSPYCIIDDKVVFVGCKVGLGDYNTIESDETHVINKFKDQFNSFYEGMEG
ncbi:MAG: hypothetical protein KAS04_02640 [Candidatus Aenigmarchaeota archaeon]|nr:hypothetical protein [Candidatus Aenigmarchaeota archaeon]